MKLNKLAWILVGIIVVIVIWGIIGSSQAAKVGINCDIGFGEDGSMLCWKWHKNVIGEIGDTLNSVFGK